MWIPTPWRHPEEPKLCHCPSQLGDIGIYCVLLPEECQQSLSVERELPPPPSHSEGVPSLLPMSVMPGRLIK